MHIFIDYLIFYSMKKILIILIIFFLFLISSCKKQEESKIECMKVSCIEDLTHSTLTVYLNIYTTLDVETIKIPNQQYLESSILTLKKITEYCFEEQVEKAFVYQFLLTFKNEVFTLTKIKLLINDISQTMDIGLYKTIKINHDDVDIKVTTNIVDQNIEIYVHNNLDRTIYLTKVEEYLMSNLNLQVGKINLSETYLYSGATRSFNVIELTIPQNYKMVSGILKLEFTTNLKKYQVYATYYLNDTVEVLNII